MKKWTMLVALVVMLGMTAFVDAKEKKKGGGGMHGKIASVTPNGFTMTTGGKNNLHNVTVIIDATTSVTIQPGKGAATAAATTGKIDATQIGKHVTVVGTSATNGAAETITATSVTVGGHHHKKKKAAA